MKRIAIVDYGLGNLFNVERALAVCGAAPVITDDDRDIDRRTPSCYQGWVRSPRGCGTSNGAASLRS